MNRLIKEDKELHAAFEVQYEEGQDTAVVKCKGKDEETGERCPASWALEVEPGGALHPGTRNPIMSHARAHQRGFSKIRRLS